MTCPQRSVVLVKPDLDKAAADRPACLPQTRRGTGGNQVADNLAALNQEIAMMREAVSARDAFLAVAAHELRNPMTPIIGRVQILARAARRPDFQVERLRSGFDQRR